MSDQPAGKTPAQVHSDFTAKREAATRDSAEKRRKLALALENILGPGGKRTTDQALVWEYLTAHAFRWPVSSETNELLIFEGMRRRSAEIIVLMDEASAH